LLLRDRSVATEEHPLKQADIAARLVLVEERLNGIEAQLARIELHLTTRVPAEEIRAAIEDVFQTWGLVAQLREVYDTMRGDLLSHNAIVDALLAEGRVKDEETRSLMIQLRELARRLVRSQEDLERALNWRPGDAERRKVG
jgi:hypothetical protein